MKAYEVALAERADEYRTISENELAEALRMEGVALDPFTITDVYRRLVEMGAFTVTGELIELIEEEARDSGEEAGREEEREVIEQGVTCDLERLADALVAATDRGAITPPAHLNTTPVWTIDTLDRLVDAAETVLDRLVDKLPEES